MIRRLLLLGLVCLMVCGLGAIGSAAVAAQPPVDHPKTVAPEEVPAGQASGVLILLDMSGSMTEYDNSGTRRIEGAKSSIIGLINSLPSGSSTRIGLQTYPASGDSCGAPQTRVEIGPLNVGRFSAAVAGLANPDGNTPTATALTSGAAALKASGDTKGTIVLVSDGEANCTGDPCEAANDIVASGLQLTVNTVGFNISDEGRNQLQCIATATGGEYYPAGDADELGEALSQAARPSLTLEVALPDTKFSATTKSIPVSVKVSNKSGVAADSVRVSVTAVVANGEAGITVLRPVRLLGRFDPDFESSAAFEVLVPLSPVASQSIQVRLTSTNAPMVETIVPIEFGNTQAETSNPRSAFFDMRTALVLGDSYSSGEGAGTDSHPYLAGPTGKSGCHRSQNQYANQLFDPSNVTILACSGATMSDFDRRSTTGTHADENKDEADQLTRLDDLLKTGYRPDVVFISLGGNDIGFSDIIRSCTIGEFSPGVDCAVNSGSDGYAARKKLVEGAAEELALTYRDIAESFESYAGEVPPIVVLPYPVVVPLNPSLRGRCRPWVAVQNTLSATNMDAVLQFQLVLNQAVQYAVETASKNWQVPVYYADDVAWAVQPDHTLCSEDSWIRRLDAPGAWDNLVGSEAGAEVMHPNASGHGAMATQLARWALTPNLKLDGARKILKVGMPAGIKPDFDYDEPGAQLVSLDASAPSSGSTQLLPGSATVAVTGVDPYSPVLVYAQSEPLPIGAGTADEDGHFSIETTVDLSTLPLGDHTIRVWSYVSGKDVELVANVTITEPSPAQWWRVIYGSAMLLLAGAVTLGVRAIKIRRIGEPGL